MNTLINHILNDITNTQKTTKPIPVKDSGDVYVAELDWLEFLKKI